MSGSRKNTKNKKMRERSGKPRAAAGAQPLIVPLHLDKGGDTAAGKEEEEEEEEQDDDEERKEEKTMKQQEEKNRKKEEGKHT